MKQLKPLIHTHTFWCETCHRQEPMTAAQLAEHLQANHGLKPPWKGRRKSTMCLDMAHGQYTNHYDLTVAGVQITEVAAGKRTP